MSPPPPNNPPRRRPPPSGGNGNRPRNGGKRKKKPNPVTGQIVGALSLLIIVALVGGVGYYVGPRFLPKPKPTPTPAPGKAVVARPSIDPNMTLDSTEPKRPGLKLMPADEIYLPKSHDIKDGSPLDPPVNGLLAKGVLTAFSDGRFRPNDPMPRAEFAVWCYNAVEAQTIAGPDPFIPAKKGFGTVEATGEEFRDVPADYWAAPVLASLKQSGLFDNVLEKEFRPDAVLTREEWMGFAADLCVSKDNRAKLPDQIDATKLAVALRSLNYTDAAAIEDAFQGPAFLILSDQKRKAWVLDTFPQPDLPGPFGPKKPMTRGEAATWLGGYYDQVGVGLM